MWSVEPKGLLGSGHLLDSLSCNLSTFCLKLNLWIKLWIDMYWKGLRTVLLYFSLIKWLWGTNPDMWVWLTPHPFTLCGYPPLTWRLHNRYQNTTKVLTMIGCTVCSVIHTDDYSMYQESWSVACVTFTHQGMNWGHTIHLWPERFPSHG